ncbi:XRE family transcriptional regulator [Streptococcus entericus]|uniref:XRE family transcriptional regulator n=1 Tax=Streptococcus entericus TaxID=155680 RepID=UPI000377AF7C|nr:XRE family transcriptional regulator [Streptococcus entericus]
MFSKDRLKQRRAECKLSQTEIASRLEVNRTAYHNWENGKNIPNQKNLLALAKILEVDPTYFESEHNIVSNFLQLNHTNQLKAETLVERLLIKQRAEENKVVNLIAYNVIKNVALAAGPGYGFDDEYETEVVYSDEEYSGFDIAAWIDGTSMEPKYLDGEVALIRATGFDYDGAVYALVWEGRTYIKKLYREPGGFRMVSINKKGNPDRFISSEDELRIVGKVVGHFMPIVGG